MRLVTIPWVTWRPANPPSHLRAAARPIPKVNNDAEIPNLNRIPVIVGNNAVAGLSRTKQTRPVGVAGRAGGSRLQPSPPGRPDATYEIRANPMRNVLEKIGVGL